ncbi:MAG: hypothetical protein J6K28_04365 [Alistipes sp.]|nr:hypothetical protein [Alistipes sp.]
MRKIMRFLLFSAVAFYSACQRDVEETSLSVVELKPLSIADARNAFEKEMRNLPAFAADSAALSLTERCYPVWENAVVAENDNVWSVETPIKSDYEFVATRRGYVEGKNIIVNMDVVRKLVVIKNKRTGDVFQYVMSIIPDVFICNGRVRDFSYDFHYFGDKKRFSGVILFNDAFEGRTTQVERYCKGERCLGIYLPKYSARYDIARKIVGMLEIKRIHNLQAASTRYMWYCPICEIMHDSDDEWLPCAVIVVEDDICGGCGMGVRDCICSYNNACVMCGCDPCECYTGDNCSSCGQPFQYCICNAEYCEYCGDIYCTTDHSSENDQNNPNQSKVQCNDANVSELLARFDASDLGHKILSKLTQAIEIIFGADHKSPVRINYLSDGTIISITVRDDASSAARTTGIIEDVIHAAQISVVGAHEFSGAKLNFEIEAKCLTAIFFADHDGLFLLKDVEGYNECILKLATSYFYNNESPEFQKLYQDAINYFTNTPPYNNNDMYPEQEDKRHFNTF